MHTRAVWWVALESVFEILVANMLKTTTLKTNNFKKSRSKNGGNLRNEPSTITASRKITNWSKLSSEEIRLAWMWYSEDNKKPSEIA